MRQVTTPVTESGPGGARLARPGRAAWRQAATAGLARHWLAAALLVAGLVLRILVQLAYRPALFYIDSARYLYNAGGMDPVGYKGPLRAILFLANFDAVAAVQHLLGLAMAVLLYLVLLRRGVPRWLAALAIAPVLLDAYQLQIEQMVMPDVWFEALIVAGRGHPALATRPGRLAARAGGRPGAGQCGDRGPGGRGAAGAGRALPAGGRGQLAAWRLAAGGWASRPRCAWRSWRPSWPTAPCPT